MAISTYTELKTQVVDWLNSSQLDSQIDTFISLAESRLRREFRCREMLTRETIGVVGRYTELPSDFLDAITLRILSEPIATPKQLELEAFNRIRVDSTQRPMYFTVHEQIEFDSIPDQAYTGELIYYRDFSPLSASVETNFLLTAQPDAYFYATLLASSPFLQDDERIQLWKGLYDDVKRQVNRLSQKKVGTPIAAVPGVLP